MSALRLQLYYPGGRKVGNEIIISKSLPKNNLPDGSDSPVVAGLNGGGSSDLFVVTWVESDSNNNNKIQSQLFETRSGDKVGPPFNPFNGLTPESMLWARIATLSSYGPPNTGSSAVMTWQNARENLNTIYVSLLSSQGIPSGGFPYQIDQPANSNSYKPYIVSAGGYSGTSGYAVVYRQTREGGGGYIMLNVFTSVTGTENIKVEVTSKPSCENCLDDPMVGSLGGGNGGGYVVVWGYKDDKKNSEVLFFSTFKDKGEIVKDQVQFTFDNEYSSKPRVLGSSNLGFVVCWNNHQTDPGSNVCQAFDSDGKPSGERFMIMIFH